MAVVNPGSVGFGASCVSRDVRGLISCGLPERSKNRVSVVKKKEAYSRISDFVISVRNGARCSSLPGDGASSKNLGINSSSSGKNLRWIEEDVLVDGVRNVSVVQAFPEESGASDMLELLDSDRPHPISGGASVSMLDGAMAGGNEVQTMTAAMYRPKLLWFTTSEAEENRFIDRALNALLAGAAISYAFTKVVTVDHDVWHGWTMFEVLKYAPLHNWHAYEEVLKSNPILAKMMISGVVYSIGDWIGQVMYFQSFCFNFVFSDFRFQNNLMIGLVPDIRSFAYSVWRVSLFSNSAE